MTNFTVSPMSLTFPKVNVQGPIPGLYATAPTQTFTLKNTSGVSAVITNYGFSTSTEGDAVTQPAGIAGNSDFIVIPTAGAFPVTVANGASQSFTVTYSPLRRGSGFGDIRSVILTLFSGNKALTNGSQAWAQGDLDNFVNATNTAGEVVNMSVPIPITVGVGGGVIEEAYDWAAVSPLYRSAGVAPTNMAGVKSNVQGMTSSSSIADLDTFPHQSPMMFWTGFQIGVQTSVYRAPSVSTYTTAGASVPYAILAPSVMGSPRGGRGYQILVFFNTTGTSGLNDDTLTFDLAIKAVTNAGSVTVATFLGVNYSNVGGLFVGNQAGLDLQGLSLVAVTSNFFTNGTTYNGTSAYNIGAVITG